MILQGAKQYPVTDIVVHCSYTWAKWWAGKTTKAQVGEVRRWHVRDRGWRDIGYHYVIGRDGVVVAGRPLDQIGAGVKGFNRGVVHICLMGGKDVDIADADFGDNFTPEQDAALWQLINDLWDRAGSELTVSGHNQHAAKSCPCFHVPTWHKGKRAVRESAPWLLDVFLKWLKRRKK